ncbi:MAG: phosphate/phosphite/phosphonate ABC transporter substrate-binding protein [Chloroflexi bacterium]|nr:phosphate/phosphite/phosphonate ABC transporter substrate-binding protein [Chloroflexota bacterium]
MRRLILIFGVLLLAACASPPAESVIHLSDLQPLPASASGDIVPLRVAVAAVISPRGTAESYQPLLDYLSAKLNRPVELVQRRTYAEINDLVQKEYVDVAFVCTSAYVAGARDFGMQLLFAPQVNGETVYYSFLIVPAGSPAQSMADLRGKVFAFTDPMSNTGRLYPTFLVHEFGETPQTFFARTFFTYSHDDAIRAVVEGVADGAAVDSLVYEYAVKRDPSIAERVRVIHRSPPFGIPPVVVGPNIRPQLRVELRDLLLGMAGDPDGRILLATLGIDRFVEIDDRAYDSVRELEAEVGLLP